MSVDITWTATALGGDFAATIVQREHDTGWCDIYRILTEATDEVTDYEHRWGVAESYRVLVEDTDGVRSVPPGAVTGSPITKTDTGDTFRISSNAEPTINATMLATEPVTIGGLGNRQITTSSAGRTGFRTFRDSIRKGQRLGTAIELTDAEDFTGLLDGLEAAFTADIPYVCITTLSGSRWFASAEMGDAAFQQVGGPGLDGYGLLPVTFSVVDLYPTVVTVP